MLNFALQITVGDIPDPSMEKPQKIFMADPVRGGDFFDGQNREDVHS